MKSEVKGTATLKRLGNTGVEEFDREWSLGGERGAYNWPIHGVWY